MKLFTVNDTNIACNVEEVTSLPQKGYLWLLVERREPFDIKAWLKKFGRELNERHIDDCRQPNHPSFYDCMKDYDIVIFRSLSERHDGQHRRQFDSTTFIHFPGILITLYDENNPNILKVLNMFTAEGRAVPETPDVMIEYYLHHLVDRLLDVKQSIDNRLGIWQKKLLQAQAASPDWNGLLDFQNDVRRLKALCEEQSDLINAWRANVRLELHKSHQHDAQLLINLNDLAEHSGRVLRVATQSQLELQALMQLHFTILSHRTNEIMRIVALVTGIFLPANLITGIFGMNFTHIPDLTKPDGFFFALGSMVAIAAILLIFFRWRKWL